jgi:Family of unknown function (DUF6311)
VTERARLVMLYMAGALLGLAVFFTASHPSFLARSSPRWAWPSGDLGTYQTAGVYFVHDRWRLPLFSLPAMGYPEGGSVIYNDAVPLGALVSKIIFAVSGVFVNHLPWALLAAYVLQGVMAVRLVRALGVRTPGLVVAISAWPLLSIPFLLRFVHIALAFQGLLLWALALYFEQCRARRVRVAEQTLLGVVGLLINPYLLAMVLLILGAGWLALVTRRALTARDFARGVAMAAVWGIVAAAAGFLSVPSAARMSTGEHGHYSWNLATLVTATPGIPWSDLFGPVTRDATGGQYEGESFPGIGVLFVTLICLLTTPAAVGQALRRHWTLCVVLAACTAFAASDRVYFGSNEILSVGLPRWAGAISGVLRTQGRFIWPLVYVLTLAPIALLVARRSRVLVVVLVALVTVSKVIEAGPTVRLARSESVRGDADLIGTPQMTIWMREHTRVWQFPSFWCGGLTSPTETGEAMRARQVQLQLLSARLGMATNSVYTSRPIKDCSAEWAWARYPTLRLQTFYVVTRTPFERMQALDAIIHGPECRDAGWAYVCSRRWAATAAAGAGEAPPP